LSRKIDEIIRVPLSKKIMFEELKSCTVAIDRVDDAVTFSTDTATRPSVDQKGYIVIDRFKPRD